MYFGFRTRWRKRTLIRQHFVGAGSTTRLVLAGEVRGVYGDYPRSARLV